MTESADILLVDDDDRLRQAAGKVLRAEGYSVATAATGEEAREVLKRTVIRLVLCDLRLPDLSGLALLKEARELRPEAEVVMITGHGSVEEAVEAMKMGAYDFIQKPLDSTSLIRTAAKALERQSLASENRRLRQQLDQRHSVEALLGNSPPMMSVKHLIRQIAATDVPVFIQGESGTGKEVVADALHGLSERRGKRLVKISCAAIPETLLESELFGHERGAFTGATTGKPGKLELADGGTLLLDEIAEMSPALQAKLLRVLQDGQFQRLGGTRDLRADFRLLSATHADIPGAIAADRFRQDLYYRINTVQIALPPLRDRAEDIPLLAAHFVRVHAARMGKPTPAIARSALDQLLGHSWPGNVRELEHAMQRAIALLDGDTIRQVAFAPFPDRPGTHAIDTLGSSSLSIPVGTTLDEATRRLVQATLERCDGNKLQAAKMLGVAPRTMYRRFSKPRSQCGES